MTAGELLSALARHLWNDHRYSGHLELTTGDVEMARGFSGAMLPLQIFRAWLDRNPEAAAFLNQGIAGVVPEKSVPIAELIRGADHPIPATGGVVGDPPAEARELASVMRTRIVTPADLRNEIEEQLAANGNQVEIGMLTILKLDDGTSRFKFRNGIGQPEILAEIVDVVGTILLCRTPGGTQTFNASRIHIDPRVRDAVWDKVKAYPRFSDQLSFDPFGEDPDPWPVVVG